MIHFLRASYATERLQQPWRGRRRWEPCGRDVRAGTAGRDRRRGGTRRGKGRDRFRSATLAGGRVSAELCGAVRSCPGLSQRRRRQRLPPQPRQGGQRSDSGLGVFRDGGADEGGEEGVLGGPGRVLAVPGQPRGWRRQVREAAPGLRVALPAAVGELRAGCSVGMAAPAAAAPSPGSLGLPCCQAEPGSHPSGWPGKDGSWAQPWLARELRKAVLRV